ncbi:MBL fold metallo-hydrolase [Desulfosediminicola ganghwensis]|uniref:MBL fold metallo-hydrolase n=1 Tax=Desulfosediminicola ganghwensis TaxID=2569540 RepID=UPI001E412998|nr:MBL fold metallo-hydrolase [Desulfosediminicola ganghwensis]
MKVNPPPNNSCTPKHINVTHLGAKECVTGSCHLVQYESASGRSINILVDCGSSYGDDPELPFEQFPVAPNEINYLFLTHAHIDHIGRVLDLIDAGFAGEIICSHATKALLEPMLIDSLSFSSRSKREVQAITIKLEELTWGFELRQAFSLKEGVTFRLGNAGHILGSCFILFSFPSNSSKNDFKILFSGDLGCTNTPILPDPDPPPECDLLILESTYGDRTHPDRSKRIEQLKELLKKALADKGIVYIPAFALGRTQELLYELDRINLKIPVFVDSPLALKITDIYAKLSSLWDDEAKELNQKGDHPFDFKGLYSVKSYRDHKQLLEINGPAIIIAGSGMCTGGRILDHLEQGLQDPRNDIFFVGYQAKGTLGRRLIEGEMPVRAAIHSLSSYSAHADQQMLIDWVALMTKAPKEIRLVHGDEQARRELAEQLNQKER